MTIRSIDPREAKRLIDDGALLVDVREPDEHARERIYGARLVPLSRFPATLVRQDGPPVIFHCRSGSRTAAAVEQLAAATGADGYMLGGGIAAWKAAGLPVLRDHRKPIEMMRQVQIVAGSLVLIGVGLGATVDPKFYALSGFVGAGLVFAGATGTCGMARLLALAPWNKAAQA
jgi:rhodanese-related sulfurtransferase